MAGPLVPLAIKAIGKGIAAKICTAKACEIAVGTAATGAAAYAAHEMDDADPDDVTDIPIE